MLTDRTIPAHALFIWAEGDAIRVALEATIITLPKPGKKIQARGAWQSALELALVKLLQEREAHAAPLIGELAAPTQAQVPALAKSVADAWLAEDRERKAQMKEQAALATLAQNAERARGFLAEIGL